MQTTVITMSTNTIASTKKADDRCIDCQLRSFQRLMTKFNLQPEQQLNFMDFYHQTILQKDSLSMPEMHRILNKHFCTIINDFDPYKTEKKECNDLSLSLYQTLKERVQSASDPFNMALRLSISGNIMDYAQGHRIEVEPTISKVLNSDFAIDHSKILKQKIQSASSILYLGDNAGEIVFDKLFIETINHPNLTFAVRGAKVINDATMEDAEQIGMNKIASVISNGDNTPGTILKRCSDEFLEIYRKADLIISKGQGNLEGLIEEQDSRIFFLLMIKCDVIAEELNVSKGDFVVYNQSCVNN